MRHLPLVLLVTLAAPAHAGRFDPARVRTLSGAWQREILSGRSSVRDFYQRYDTSKREIGSLRKSPEYGHLFPSATGLHSTLRKQTHDGAELSRLSGLWKRQVVPGKLSITEFKQQQGLTQRGYRELRRDKQAFPEPKKTVHAGGPARRELSLGQLTAMKADWRKVLSGEMPRAAFMRKHGMHSKMFKRVRDEHPGDFPEMGAAPRRQFSLGQLETMKTAWLEVVAGRKRESDFREQYDLSTGLFARLRSGLGSAAHFPKLKGKAAPLRDGVATPGVIKDWDGVREGTLSAATFRKRHPDVRAADLLALQRSARNLGALLEKTEPAPLIPADKLALLRTAWPRVERGEATQKSVLAQIGIPEHRLRAYRKENPGELQSATRRPRPGSRYEQQGTYSASQLTAARELYARYHRGEIRDLGELKPALQKLGITTTGQGLAYLRKLDPRAFCSRNAFAKRNHGAMVDELVRIASAHPHVIRKWSDLLELVGRDQQFNARFGKQNLALEGWIVKRDREGERRLYAVMERIGTQMGKDSGPRPGGASRTPAVQTPASSGPKSRRESARDLASALEGKTPSKSTLQQVVARLAREDKNLSSRKKWMGVRSEHEGVYPELSRWNFDTHRPFSLRYVARWTEAAHQAGAGASYEKIAAIFKRSPEYREDGRLPPKRSGTAQMAQGTPELVSSWSTRRTYQRTHQLLELLRTAPAGQTLYGLRGQLKKIGLSYRYAHKWLGQMSAADAEQHGMKRATFEQLQRGGFKALGQARDPGFDANAEPPGVDMKLVRDILDTPRMPPVLEYAIRRLDGRRPFEHQNVMFVNHRYSDIVSLVDAMARAGMEYSNATFVSTPYPFRDAVTYQLEKRGVQTIVPELNMRSYAKSVEQGIRRMLALHEQQRQKWGKGKPILIMDDGGMASKIIGEKFRADIGKFRIVEVTAAGHRLAREFQKKYGRLPFVYYSIAYTRLKRKVTSQFYGSRVADRVLSLIPQTGQRLQNKRVAVIGGGPMGIYAGVRLREKGYDVTFVDPDPGAQRKLRWLKFDVKPIEQALPGRGIVLGMTGFQTLGAKELALVDSGAFVAQGSSKRNEFDMSAFERMAKKTELPRSDGLSQKSFTYAFRGGKKLHFLGDGWTINHDGSLHGTPMKDIQLELGLYFETAAQAAATPLGQTGTFREVTPQVQWQYHEKWRQLTGR